MAEAVIVDASAMVDLLVRSQLAAAIGDRLRGHELHAPAHFDAEVLSALGRLHRAGLLSSNAAQSRLRSLEEAPIARHHVAPLLLGAWRLRQRLRLVDALYVELSKRLEATLVTTDGGLATSYPASELITA